MSLEAWMHPLITLGVSAWRFCRRKVPTSIVGIPWNFVIVLRRKNEPSLSKAASFQCKRLTAQWSSGPRIWMSSPWAGGGRASCTTHWPESTRQRPACHLAPLRVCQWGLSSLESTLHQQPNLFFFFFSRFGFFKRASTHQIVITFICSLRTQVTSRRNAKQQVEVIESQISEYRRKPNTKAWPQSHCHQRLVTEIMTI